MPTSDPGTAYARWDVVVVPFPYADRLAEKRRPALVISNSRLAALGLVWVAMITSAENKGWDCDVDMVDPAATGLTALSVVRPAKIACIDTSRILRRIGSLDVATADAVGTALDAFLS
ncbi:MAG: type II toxin-antitoxin system PemK/MazF family toxin [Rhodoplanes sp.]|uniref:type II toxin-antitoxin system PemK/MazF family toxin n=1 Tax=Rhodoplanes sp. TaxID=1968906 RepID=UPI0017EE6998|nr:type II toxin-antitoxin system PemK/MazF family toxin [Rhodoplanes sp.]NVO12895.1 type II toxin-antitoxin system PemK/MazF family toxin [Rhodoplanes sp.]